MRTCIACRQKRPKRELVRIVRTPEGNIEVDPKGKSSGRGAYLCSDQTCWALALDHEKLGRALKCQVSAADVAGLKQFAELLAAQAAPAATGEAALASETAVAATRTSAVEPDRIT
jgi:predicted RNA-binding protein YlxR (DUF448 family)